MNVVKQSGPAVTARSIAMLNIDASTQSFLLLYSECRMLQPCCTCASVVVVTLYRVLLLDVREREKYTCWIKSVQCLDPIGLKLMRRIDA